METLDLHVEHRAGVDTDAKRHLDVMRQPLFVALLDGRPLLSEGRILRELGEHANSKVCK